MLGPLGRANHDLPMMDKVHNSNGSECFHRRQNPLDSKIFAVPPIS
jgi:hypothetical protein